MKSVGMTFAYVFDAGELGDLEAEVECQVTSRGSGEDFEVEAEVESVEIGGADVGGDLDSEVLDKIAEKACERYLDTLPCLDDWMPGRYRWEAGPRKGREVEVLGVANLPGRADWVVVARERGEGWLDRERLVLYGVSDLNEIGADGEIPNSHAWTLQRIRVEMSDP